MKKRILITLAAAFFAAAALIYLYFTGEGEGAGIPCVFYQALRYNAIFTFAIPLIAAYFCALFLSYIRFGKDKISEKIPMKIIWIFIAVALIYGILRNIPAFSFLAPITLEG